MNEKTQTPYNPQLFFAKLNRAWGRRPLNNTNLYLCELLRGYISGDYMEWPKYESDNNLSAELDSEKIHTIPYNLDKEDGHMFK